MDKSKSERRSDKTYPKRIYLTEFGRIKIEAWAETHNINFSAAIETLALMGLEDNRADYAIPAVRATTLQGIQLAFNRLARLLSIIAMDSAVNRMANEAVLLQLIRELADEHPDDFEAIMRVPRDSQRTRDMRIRRFHDDVKTNMSQSAAQKLRQPVTDFEQLLRDASDLSA